MFKEVPVVWYFRSIKSSNALKSCVAVLDLTIGSSLIRIHHLLFYFINRLLVLYPWVLTCFDIVLPTMPGTCYIHPYFFQHNLNQVLPLCKQRYQWQWLFRWNETEPLLSCLLLTILLPSGSSESDATFMKSIFEFNVWNKITCQSNFQMYFWNWLMIAYHLQRLSYFEFRMLGNSLNFFSAS
jgi:hypothetical protein